MYSVSRQDSNTPYIRVLSYLPVLCPFVQVTTNTKREQSLELTWDVMGLAKSVHNRNRMLVIVVWGLRRDGSFVVE